MLDPWKSSRVLVLTTMFVACGPGDHQLECSNGDIAAQIVPSDYDQTCQMDSDCVIIAVDFCNGCPWCSNTDAINKTSQPQYFDDLKKRDGETEDRCRCSGPRIPCCVLGKCQSGTTCNSSP